MSDPSAILNELWNNGQPTVDLVAATTLPNHIVEAIPGVINAEFSAFRYILPSQLLAKLVDPSRHALALQAGSELPGSFDARTFCKSYIVEFDRQNHRVLGGSEDPLVGNIGRRPQMDQQWLAVGHRERNGGGLLVVILSYAQKQPKHTRVLLQLTLAAIAERLKKTNIVYPRPNRISLTKCEELIAGFLAPRSGGRRLQTTAAALFDAIGARFGLFEKVEVGHINKADTARGDVADLDCLDINGKSVLNVEVKDRELNIREVEDTLKVARDRGIAEIIYLIRGGVPVEEQLTYENFKIRQFTAGHNIYEIEFEAMLHACLILFGENGRLALLEAIGKRVDAHGELKDRQDWQAELLKI